MKEKFTYSFRIAILMLFSQMVLLAFTGHWLYSQYNNEKSNLKRDIARQLADTKLQLVDSMLLIHLINPILNDEKGFKLHVAISDEESPPLNDRKKVNRNRSFAFFQSSDSTIPKELFDRKIEKTIEMEHQSDSANNLLVKGIKLIYNEVKSSTGEDMFDEEALMKNTDTVLFKKLFSANLTKNDLNFPLKWKSQDTADKLSVNPNTLFFDSRLFPNAYGVEFSGFQLFLLKRISPQILFACILILLTGAAFYFSHKSLKNQMRLSELKSDFISNISHELKTPVSTVKVAIEALLDTKRINDANKVKEYLEIAALEISRLEQLIGKVLDTSTLEGRKDMIQPEYVKMNLLIDEVLQSFRHRFRETNAVLRLDKIDPGIEASIDKLHVQGVLINLIDNSLKYGNENPEIGIQLHKKNDEIILSVSDNGRGIPDEYLDKVFEKFFRVPHQDIHNVKGSGLGLSYAALVMHHHKGSIAVEKHSSGGCIFTLKFPSS